MTQNRIRPRGKHGTKTFTVRRKTPVPNGEHTTVKAMKAAICHRSIDGLARIAQRSQLTNRDNPMLTLRKVRKPPVLPKVRRAFVPHSDP